MDKNTRPLSLPSHSNFFSSLKQVEKRLKLEQTTSTESQTTQERTNSPSGGSLNSASSGCSPMFLHVDQPSGSHFYGAAQDSSEPPLAFLSIPQGFTPSTHQHPSQTTAPPHNQIETAVDVDDIERLLQLLGLSEEQVRDGPEDDDNGIVNSCHCEGGFYSKIVGVKGPKCRKEVQRLDGWIKYFLNGGGGEEKLEPLILAHLLLGKAAFLSDGAEDGFGGLEFPSTIQEFLHNDPPS